MKAWDSTLNTMKDDKHYKSDAFAAIHESADALHKIGAINKKTMRGFDEACLTPMPTQISRALPK
uniref:FIG050068: DNA-binding protein n=1 Tax=uncultured Thiotrichaceae bacterium TaxID=298394 RepID=A0A6S6SYH8_9GAMM|nr:MAG: FIG050068: DNA-binding protein [uncultured Thiotrichaceae bacterium]